MQVEEGHVCKLKKAMYGLKQAPRAWYGRIDSFLMSLDFTKSKVDPNLYFKVIEDEPIILLLYMDDLFLTWNEKQITYCKKKLAEEFKMKRYWTSALFPQAGSAKEFRRNLSEPGKVCCGNLKEYLICWIVNPWPHPWIPT